MGQMSTTAQKERRPGGGSPRRQKDVKHGLIDAFILPRTAGGVKRMIFRAFTALAYILAALWGMELAVNVLCR